MVYYNCSDTFVLFTEHWVKSWPSAADKFMYLILLFCFCYDCCIFACCCTKKCSWAVQCVVQNINYGNWQQKWHQILPSFIQLDLVCFVKFQDFKQQPVAEKSLQCRFRSPVNWGKCCTSHRCISISSYAFSSLQLFILYLFIYFHILLVTLHYELVGAF